MQATTQSGACTTYTAGGSSLRSGAQPAPASNKTPAAPACAAPTFPLLDRKPPAEGRAAGRVLAPARQGIPETADISGTTERRPANRQNPGL